MASIFGRSEDDHERLRSTVRSLGVTSVPGLAAALAWRERKTERLLAHELARPGSEVVYEPGRRLVRWRRPLPPPAAAAREGATPAGPSSTPTAPTPTPRPGSAVLRGTTLKTLCPSCHAPLLATGSGSLAVCPQCGRLSTERAARPSTPGATPPTPAPAAEPLAAAPPRSVADPVDRRSQELFAAYVTSRPIPCPRCRTPLKHRGVAEYACPNCGQAVQFGRASQPVTIRPT